MTAAYCRNPQPDNLNFNCHGVLWVIHPRCQNQTLYTSSLLTKSQKHEGCVALQLAKRSTQQTSCHHISTFLDMGYVCISLDTRMTLQCASSQGGHLRRSALPNRLTSAAYHRFSVVIYQNPWQVFFSISDNTCGSCMMGRHLLLPAL